MAEVVHRTTKAYLESVSTPEYRSDEWIINPTWIPNRDSCLAWHSRYWNLVADTVSVMPSPQRDTVDAANEAQSVLDAQAAAKEPLTVAAKDDDGEGIKLRELIELFNKRDNYLINRILELQAALTALQSSTGNAGARLDALPRGYSATNTRTRAEAVQAYRDDIDAGTVNGAE